MGKATAHCHFGKQKLSEEVGKTWPWAGTAVKACSPGIWAFESVIQSRILGLSAPSNGHSEKYR